MFENKKGKANDVKVNNLNLFIIIFDDVFMVRKQLISQFAP